MTHRRRAASAAALVAMGIGFAVATADPAGAQEGTATIEVERANPAGTSVHYIVQVTDADGQPVRSADVTATPTHEDGTQGTPVQLGPAANPGFYQGTVDLPAVGTWTITIASARPEAWLDCTLEVPTEESGGVCTSRDVGGDDDGGGGFSGVVIVLGAVVVILLGFGLGTLLRHRAAAR